MKLSKKEILTIPLEGQSFTESLVYTSNDIPAYMGVRSIERCNVRGMLRFDAYSKHLMVDVDLLCEIILPCSISFKDVPYRIKTKSMMTFGFEYEEGTDVIEITRDEFDLKHELLSLIWLEVPSQVISDSIEQLPSGKDWQVLTEATYRQQHKKPDERLAKLKDFKFDDE